MDKVWIVGIVGMVGMVGISFLSDENNVINHNKKRVRRPLKIDQAFFSL